ncbi:MAG: hypothetical protein ABI207_06120 [Crocinitomicaceae bacterium]
MKYFIKITKTLQPKNQLDAEIIKFIEKEDNTLLSNKSLRVFIDYVRNNIVFINRAHTRCTARELSGTNFENIHSYDVSGIIQFMAYEVKIED